MGATITSWLTITLFGTSLAPQTERHLGGQTAPITVSWHSFALTERPSPTVTNALVNILQHP
jgi:hypothetical protein